MAEQLQIEATIAARDAATPELARAGRGFQDLGGVMDRFVITAGDTVDALQGIQSAIQESFQIGNQTRILRRELESSGQSFEDFLTRVRSATRGTTSEVDAVQASLQALRLGIDQADLPGLFEIATVRGVEFGRSTGQALDDITRGVGRLSPKILDNLGLNIRLADAYDRYATTIGTTVDALTDLEKKQAVIAEIFRQSKENVEKANEALSETSVLLGRIGAAADDTGPAVTNLLLRFAEIPAIQAVLLGWAEIIERINEKLTEGSRIDAAYEAQQRSAREAAEAHEELRKSAEAVLNILIQGPGAIDAYDNSLNIMANSAARSKRLLDDLSDAQKGLRDSLDLLTRTDAEKAIERLNAELANYQVLADASELSAIQFAEKQREIRDDIAAVEAVLRGEIAAVEDYQAVLDDSVTSVNDFGTAHDAAIGSVDAVTDSLGREAVAAERVTVALERQVRQLAFTSGEYDRIAASAGRAAAAQAAVEAGARQFGNRVFLPGGGSRFVTEPGFPSGPTPSRFITGQTTII